jgi:soluble lytic murein transglycosylase
MGFKWILTCVAALSALAGVSGAQAQARGDDALLDMASAYKRGEYRKLAGLLPQVQGHPLEGLAAYWALRSNLEGASEKDIQSFLQRYQGQYVEDRLRNDWLLMLGRQKDWQTFAREYALYRMRDDREVRCHAAQIEMRTPSANTKELREVVLRNWYAQKEIDDGCDGAVQALYKAGLVTEPDLWRKARMAIEANKPKLAEKAVAMVSPRSATAVEAIYKSTSKFLKRYASQKGAEQGEIHALAIIRLASSDIDGAVEQMAQTAMSVQAQSWVWAVLGKSAHFKASPDALVHFRKARNEDLSDDLLAWKARVMLREKQWQAASEAIDHMSDAQRTESTWIYWKARCLMALGPEDGKALARVMLDNIASARGFYEMLAAEELGRPVVTPAPPEPLMPAEKEAARQNPGLQRALYAIELGLRAEGVREWNYTTNLHKPGGMDDRELLAAADWACEKQVWDRCINSSERTKTVFDHRQRFPMPLRDIVVPRSNEIGLDPAYVYGLIRQESRFIMDARSHVGASGLMQVMPATAKWTAKKIGMTNFTRDSIYDRDTNVRIGTGYLKLVLDNFEGSMPMAAAAYNAGPGRPRNWRNGPVLEGAVWAEGVPFTETRDYVKKVLANTTMYAAILSGQPQSLKKRLGNIAPRDTAAPADNQDLP